MNELNPYGLRSPNVECQSVSHGIFNFTARAIMRGLLKPLRPESGELLCLDALRFIAAMGIVIDHSLGRTDIFKGIDAQSLRLFVDLFFLISGYVIAHVYFGKLYSSNGYFRFLMKRVARLGPLHWLMLLGSIVVATVVWTTGVEVGSPERYDPACIAPNALLLHALYTCGSLSFNSPSWSISAEAAMYVIAPILFVLSSFRLLGWLAVVSLWVGLSMLDGQPWHSWTSNGGAIRALPSFLLGVMLYRERELIGRIMFGGWLAMAALALFVVALLNGVNDLALLFILYMVVIFSVSADIRGEVPHITRKIAPLGQLTYSIYMIHELWLIGTISFLSERVLGLRGTSLDLAVLLSVLCVIGISYLSLMLFEQPSRRAITRWYDRRAAYGKPSHETA